MCVPNSPRGGYSWESLVGECHPALRILTLFQTKKCDFPHPFSDLTSKIPTCFQSWRWSQNATYVITLTEIMLSLLRLEHQQKYLFPSYSFIILIIETTNTFIHYRSSLISHIRFQTKMNKVFTRFHTLWGGISYMAYSNPPGQ